MAPGSGDSENSQLKTCKKCHGTPQSGVKCKKCGSVTHPGCVKYLKNIIILDDHNIICCENNVQSEVIEVSHNSVSNEYKTEISYLKDTIKQKDDIIFYQKELIESLKKQVQLYEKLQLNAVPKEAPSKQVNNESTKLNLIKQTKNSNCLDLQLDTHSAPLNSNIKNPVPSTYAKALGTKQRQKCDELININSDIKSDNSIFEQNKDKKEIRPVANKKRKHNNNTTLGNLTDNCEISAIESRRSLFVSRLKPTTTGEQLAKHLTNYKIKYTNIEKLNIKSEEIAAFKITVPVSEVDNINNSQAWPKYTIIRPFRRQALQNFQK